MAEWDYGWDYGGSAPYDDWSWASTPDYMSGDAYQSFTGWGDPTGIGSSGDTSFSGEGSGGWLNTILGGLGQAGSFLGQNAGTLGPLISGAGSIAGGAIGSNAANEAARLQAQALNRGIDLNTAQWLQQQGNLAPYLQAGQQGLSTLQGLAGREQPGLPPASAQVQRSWYDAQMPQTTPGWSPQEYQGPGAPQAGDYRWNPQQGPQAQDYRYTPGQTPDAAQYASGPPQLYQGARPGTQVPTLSGQELLAQDPGAAFRQSEARKALEGSAAARGDLLSGGTLQALQSRSQDLASQEYQNAWERMMRRNTEQYGRDWGQYQQNWNQGVTGAELGLRTQQQNFAQAEAAARLREQVNQVASQQGWSQATAEAVFRESMAQQASQQGWAQALGGQQNQFTQGLQQAQWNQGQQQQWEADQYKRQLEQNQLMYGRDFAENEANYGRNQTQYRQQLAQYMLPFEQQSILASLGGQAVGMYGTQGQSAANSISNLLGQTGTANAMGTLGSAGQWNQAISGGVGSLQNVLKGLNA